MSNKIKSIDPEKVYFTMLDGKPYFYVFRAFTHKNLKTGKEEYTQKQLDQISRELFDIEQFNKNQPTMKGTWELVEEETGVGEGIGKGRCYIVRFFPFVGEKNPEQCCRDLKSVLKLMYR